MNGSSFSGHSLTSQRSISSHTHSINVYQSSPLCKTPPGSWICSDESRGLTSASRGQWAQGQAIIFPKPTLLIPFTVIIRARNPHFEPFFGNSDNDQTLNKITGKFNTSFSNSTSPLKGYFHTISKYILHSGVP